MTELLLLQSGQLTQGIVQNIHMLHIGYFILGWFEVRCQPYCSLYSISPLTLRCFASVSMEYRFIMYEWMEIVDVILGWCVFLELIRDIQRFLILPCITYYNFVHAAVCFCSGTFVYVSLCSFQSRTVWCISHNIYWRGTRRTF